MSRKTAKDFRDTLTDEDIINILKKFDVDPVRIMPNYIIFPTVDHNLEGGSSKLYYYKNNKMFKSYTGEGRLFDIFQLIIDMHNLRGKEISLRESMAFCGIDTKEPIEDNEYYGIKKQLDYFYKTNNVEEEEKVDLITYDISILNRFIYDNNALKIWILEGITEESLIKYRIKFDPVQNAIIIPYFSKENDLVGVRGRFLSSDAYAKYMPIKYNGKFLVHPTGKILYGLNINYRQIKESSTVVLFEGEKSVMKMDSIYGDQNISLAVSGKSLTKDHVSMLIELDVRNIIVAFDRDYKSINELEEEIEKMRNSLRYALNFFNISMIIDEDFLLEHKNSPIDQGKEIFDKLMEKRIFL